MKQKQRGRAELTGTRRWGPIAGTESSRHLCRRWAKTLSAAAAQYVAYTGSTAQAEPKFVFGIHLGERAVPGCVLRFKKYNRPKHEEEQPHQNHGGPLICDRHSGR